MKGQVINCIYRFFVICPGTLQVSIKTAMISARTIANESGRPHSGTADIFAVFLILTAAVVLLWPLSGVGTAHACSCVPPGKPAEELEGHAAVFAGQVVSVDHSFEPGSAALNAEDRTTVEFAVNTVWKGDVDRNLKITTPPTGGSCGVAFAEGEEYVVYAYDSSYGDGGYSTSICSRTNLVNNAAEDLDALGEGSPPGKGTVFRGQDRELLNGRNVWLLTVVALVAAAAAGGGLLIYRRRGG